MISGHLLRQARLRAGLTQAELAVRTGRAQSAIGRWERGEVQPSLETLRSLVRAAGYELTIGLAPADEHDEVLIRRSLTKSPAQRLHELVHGVRALRRMESVARG